MLIFTHAVPKERKVSVRTEALATVSTGFSTEGDKLGTSEVRCAATGGRRHSVAEAHSTSSRKGLAARRVRTQHTFPSPFRASLSAVDAALHCRGIKPARTSLAGRLTGTMDIRMVQHRWIRRRISSRSNRLDRGLLRD